MSSSLLVAVPILLAAGAALMPHGPWLRHAAAGTVLVSVAAAAASRATAAPASFHAINNAVLWCGIFLYVVAIAAGWRSGLHRRMTPLAGALLLALVGSAPVLVEGRVVVSVLAGLAAAATLGAWRVGSAAPAGPAALLGTGARRVQRWGMPLLLSVLLVPSLWFTITVAGADGMSLQGIRDAPFSSAAETFLAALVLPASLVLAGAWPFAFIAGGSRFAPLGALLLLAVVLPLLGEGMEHWRSLYAGWLVLSALLAGLGARWPQLLASAGLFAMACGGEWWAGTLLTIIASAMALAPQMPDGVRRFALMAAAVCGIAALSATLGVEVVFSAGMALAVFIGVLRTPLSAEVRA